MMIITIYQFIDLYQSKGISQCARNQGPGVEREQCCSKAML